MEKNKTVAEYISNHDYWKEALLLLQETMLAIRLSETVKWGAPVYTLGGKNIAGVGAFKSYVAIWFFQGALLKDKMKRLMNAQEGKTQALRQWRFGSTQEIKDDLDTILAYLEEAILNQKRGKTIKPTTNKPLVIPKELAALFLTNQEIKAAFDSFSLSKKREFTEYIGEAKRAETKQKRLEKISPLILEGKGLNDKYRR